MPPTWQKVLTKPLRQVWKAALDALTEATKIIVIGYSIPPTDMHIKYLLMAGMLDNISLRRFVFINPGKNRNELENNLFKIVRRELEEKGTLKYEQLPAGSYLVDTKHLEQINRRPFIERIAWYG